MFNFLFFVSKYSRIYFLIGKSNRKSKLTDSHHKQIITTNKIMKQPNYFEPDASFTTLDYTFAFSKYSCLSWMYPIHIIFAYLVVLTGFLAIISRVINKIRPYHAAFGKWYLIFMLWCMASSLLIHNTGLPLPILVSFVYLLVSITIGWNAIQVHKNNLYEAVKEKVNSKINSMLKDHEKDQQIDIQQLQNEQKQAIMMSKSFKQRFMSWRMLHGLLLTFSWCQMLGRTMVTNPFTTFHGCWTYPAYKSQSLENKVYAVDSVATPPFPMETGPFLALITIPTVVIIFVVAVSTTYCFYKFDEKKLSSVSTISPQNSEILNK